jgi:hypothetical protein
MQACMEVGRKDRVREGPLEVKSGIDLGIVSDDEFDLAPEEITDGTDVDARPRGGRSVPFGVKSGFPSRDHDPVGADEGNIEMVVGQKVGNLMRHGLDD